MGGRAGIDHCSRCEAGMIVLIPALILALIPAPALILALALAGTLADRRSRSEVGLIGSHDPPGQERPFLHCLPVDRSSRGHERGDLPR